jgi:hypothetical protein
LDDVRLGGLQVAESHQPGRARGVASARTAWRLQAPNGVNQQIMERSALLRNGRRSGRVCQAPS